MDLSLQEAATLMGKSPRVVRYLIKTGRLKARLLGRRYVINKSDLPQDEATLRRLAAQREKAQRLLDRALGSGAPAPGPMPRQAQGPRRPLRSRPLVQKALDLHRVCLQVGALQPDHDAAHAPSELSRRAFEALCVGCSQPEQRPGRQQLQFAREHLLHLMAGLLLRQVTPHDAQADDLREVLTRALTLIDDELLPAVEELLTAGRLS